MDPFDLRGPEFLLFYVALTAGVMGVAALLRRAFESGPVPKLDTDPYLIAYLRGGANEAMRVATVSLVDRGLLKVEGESLKAEARATDRVRRTLEHRILEAFSTAGAASSIFTESGPRGACDALAYELEKYGLLPSSPSSTTFVFCAATTSCVRFATRWVSREVWTSCSGSSWPRWRR